MLVFGGVPFLYRKFYFSKSLGVVFVWVIFYRVYFMGVSKNRGGPPKSSVLIGFSIIFTIHFGGFPLFLETSLWASSPWFHQHFFNEASNNYPIQGHPCDCVGQEVDGSMVSKWVITWVVPPPSNCGKWRFIGIPYQKCNNPGGDCYWEGGQPKL